MERRKIILSVGTLAAGGSIALGTGAFSSVEAERDVAVTVADDASAYLSIQPGNGPNGNYAETTGSDALAIDLTGDNDNIGSGIAGGEGLNTNAVTGIADLFRIQNRGTQEIELEVAPLIFIDADRFGFDGLLGVFLVPHMGRFEPGLDLTWRPPLNVMSISELSPGDEIDFSVLAFALPEGAVDGVEIEDEIEITAQAI
ncbi:hypothetical protein [Halopiger djelfimassiliensis]|uniref:hypothetical protein n=1 Tax=Halopiger djelfimassiliensis TaxID=1293047 RepID=UPI000677A0C6|nr:hypothetical protein [Halopiger djelfimassiliensis]